jgi:hypothetical protein
MPLQDGQGDIGFSPLMDVVAINEQAEQVGGNKAPLPGMKANERDNNAVKGGQNPALPKAFAHHHSGSHGQQTRKVIQMQHACNSEFLIH